MKSVAAAALSAVLLVAATGATAGVVEATEHGFTVRTELEIAAPAGRVYAALTDEVGQWWHPDHTFGGDAERLYLEAEAGGVFGERLPGGGGVRHMDVLFVQPGRMLRLGGGLGPLQGMAVHGALTIELTPLGEDTALDMTYTVAGWAPDGLAALAAPVDGVLAQQMGRLAEHVGR